jgi:DNA-binding transcriptional ArsR family regulator
MAASPAAGALDQRIVKALSHPLRTRILQRLGEGVASPNQLARALGEPLGNVSYHVRILLEHECIELVETRPRRGAIEHFYRPLIRPMLGDAEWQALPVALRRELSGRTLAELFAEARSAAEAGGFDGEHVHVARMRFALDEAGWEAMSALMAEALDGAMRIAEESLDRRAAGGEPPAPRAGEVGLVLFERP